LLATYTVNQNNTNTSLHIYIRGLVDPRDQRNVVPHEKDISHSINIMYH